MNINEDPFDNKIAAILRSFKSDSEIASEYFNFIHGFELSSREDYISATWKFKQVGRKSRYYSKTL